MLELSKRDNEIEQFNNEIKKEQKAKKEIIKITCSFNRVVSIILFSVLVNLPIVLSAEPATFKGSDKINSVILLLISGLPLLHSFISGWTLGRFGIITVTDDVFSFTVMQLFYSNIFCLTLFFAIVGWS